MRNRHRYTRGVSELTLAIETSNPSAGGGPVAGGGGTASSGSVCLGTLDGGGGCTVIARHDLGPASRHDDALMPAVALVCAAAGMKPGEVRRVAVSIGPGGFTSVRIAVTTAKMIGEATGAACVPVPTALALAHAAAGAGASGVVGVLLAWKREDVWRQRFTVGGGVVTPVDDGGIVALASAGEGCGTVVGDDEVVRLIGLRVGAAEADSPRFLRPDFDARWVLHASRGIAPIDPALLLPIYPREPEAVTKWRVLHPPRG
jgi:tRNA threonylcarbamoyl adenosine modification protein YeaZ